MSEKTFSIPNITCGHCVMTIQNELGELDGVSAVNGDADGKTVTVTWESPADESAIRETLQEINYPAAP